MKLFKKVLFGASLFGVGVGSIMSGLYFYQRDISIDKISPVERQSNEVMSEESNLNGYDPNNPDAFLRSNISFNNRNFCDEKQAASYYLSVANNFVDRKLMIGENIQKDQVTGEIINTDGLKSITDPSFAANNYKPAYLLEDNKYTSVQSEAALQRIKAPEKYIKSANGLIYTQSEANNIPTTTTQPTNAQKQASIDEQLNRLFKDVYYYQFENVTGNGPAVIDVNPLNLIDILRVKNLAIDSLNLDNSPFDIKLYELNSDKSQYSKVDNTALYNKQTISDIGNRIYTIINNFLMNGLYINVKGTINNNNKPFTIWYGIPYLSISKTSSVEYRLPAYLRSDTENINKYHAFSNINSFIDSIQAFTDPGTFRKQFSSLTPIRTAFNKVVANNYNLNYDVAKANGLFNGFQDNTIRATVHGDGNGIGWSGDVQGNNNVGIYTNPRAKFVDMSISLNVSQNGIQSYRVPADLVNQLRSQLKAAIPSESTQKEQLINQLVSAAQSVLTKKIFDGFDISSNTSRDDIKTYMSSVILNQLNLQLASALIQSGQAINVNAQNALQNLVNNLFSLNETLNSKDKMFVIQYNNQPLFSLNILSDENLKSLFMDRYNADPNSSAINVLAQTLKEYKKQFPNRVNTLLVNVSNSVSYDPAKKQVTLKPLNDNNLFVKYNSQNFSLSNLYQQLGLQQISRGIRILNDRGDTSNSDVNPDGIIGPISTTLFNSDNNANMQHLVNVYDVMLAWKKDGTIKQTRLAKIFNQTVNPSVSNTKLIKYRSEIKPEIASVTQESKDVLVLRNWLGDIIYEGTYDKANWPSDEEIKNITATAASTMTINPSTRFLYENDKLTQVANLNLIYEIRLKNTTKLFDSYKDAFNYIWRVIKVSAVKINNQPTNTNNN
ncbi:hypothetical protein [[Mycoplasma] imitans]|uniref:hypothetical protein n=1 Tax=[Mycoplasma] imitans TaxID=29560 RepID=UPI001FE0BAD9|nr:hypothetical protein [[Mycoplasma] imitans]